MSFEHGVTQKFGQPNWHGVADLAGLLQNRISEKLILIVKRL